MREGKGLELMGEKWGKRWLERWWGVMKGKGLWALKELRVGWAMKMCGWEMVGKVWRGGGVKGGRRR